MVVSRWKVAAAVLLGVGAQVLTGCAGFFVYPGSSTSTTTGGSTTVDYAFVSNSTSGSQSINGYAVSSGLLTATTGSAYNLGFVPLSMVVTPNNSYLYVANQLGGISGYAIGTGGTLNILSNNGSSILATDTATSMAISPNGSYLLVLDALTGLGAISTSITEYAIQSNGTLVQTSYGQTVGGENTQTSAFSAQSIKMAPSGAYFAVALGTGGVDIFTFNESTGVTAVVGNNQGIINPNSASEGIFALGIDASNNLYVAGTIGNNGAESIKSYLVSSSGVVGNLVSTVAVGASPVAVEVSSNNNYVYVANLNASSISAFTTTTAGVLTAVNTYSAPSNVSALGHDSTGTYLVALGYNSSTGTQISSIGSGGSLTLSSVTGTTAGSGTTTSTPAVIAMTH